MTQTRRLITALLASMAVFILWQWISLRIWPPPPRTASTQPAATAPSSEEGDRDTVGSPRGPASAAASSPALGSRPAEAVAQAVSPGQVVAQGGAATTPVALGDARDGSLYPMALEITPVGAAVTGVSIRGYHESVRNKVPYPILGPATPVGASGLTQSLVSFVTPRIRFENFKQDVTLDDVIWTLDPGSGDQHKTFFVDVVTPDGRPLARIDKTYRLAPQPEQAGYPTTFDLGLELDIRSRFDQPLTVILTQRGPVGLRKEEQRSEDRAVMSAAWQEGEVVPAKPVYRKDVFHTRTAMGRDQAEGRIAWAAAGNKYFACIMAPGGRIGGTDAPLFAGLEAFDLLSEGDKGDARERSDLTFEYITRPLDIPPGGQQRVAFDCYVGPKSKAVFEAVEAYSRRDYFATVKAFFYACAPAGLAGFMMWLLSLFHRIPPHNYGLAIIILVLVVRAILHPITKRSQVNMMKMQKNMARLQPKIQAVKERYANDRQKMNQAIMEVYREEGINPAGQMMTCLPMMLQIPIWAALWAALNSTVEIRHAPFDGWWIKDLAGQDAVVSFGAPYNVPLISFMTGPIDALNLLPILLGVSQLLQTKFMPRGTPASAAPDRTTDQLEQQRKMMMFMSGFFVLILYNAPSGLNLYIMASNLFAILEQWRIRKHIRRLEAKEAAAPVVVRPGAEARHQPATTRGSWLARKFRDIQKHADDARRVKSQRSKNRPRR